MTVIAYFGRGYLVNFINNGGDSVMAGILGILAIAILFRSIYHISARSFYAQQDTKTPLYISFIAIGLNIILAVWFTMGFGLGVYGLAWATAIVSCVEVVILFVMMSRSMSGLFDKSFINALTRMASATGFMAAVTYILVQLLPLSISDQSFLSSFPKFVLIVIGSVSSYCVFSYMFKLEEVVPIISRVQKILFYRIR